MSQIKVDEDGLHNIANNIRSAVSNLKPGKIDRDTSTTISGNVNASDAIDDITELVFEVKDAMERYAKNLDSYANAMKETDETSYS